MFGIVRYSFAITASFCVAAFGGQHAFGQTIREAPNGDLFVADTMLNAVHVLRHAPGSARPVRDEVFANGLKQPCGIAFYPIGFNPLWVYIADRDGVVRFRYRNGDLKATGKPEQIIAGIPTTHHCDRDIAFSADGLSGVALAKYRSLIATEGGTIWRAAYRETVQATHNAHTGRDLYTANCSVCHQAGGEGLPGEFPPLKGSGVVNKDDAEKQIQVVLYGMQGARAGGVVYAAAMPAFAGALNDAAIADIIDYTRGAWGNHGTPVTAAQVAVERARLK
jgi:mono/diheme cytochrome c family protein